jgi:hypothetical protein
MWGAARCLTGAGLGERPMDGDDGRAHPDCAPHLTPIRRQKLCGHGRVPRDGPPRALSASASPGASAQPLVPANLGVTALVPLGVAYAGHRRDTLGALA